MWWLENSCVCYGSDIFDCVCGAADDIRKEVSEDELKDLVSKGFVVQPSSEESDGSCYLNPIVKIGWYKVGESFVVHRLTPSKRDKVISLKKRSEKYDIRNRVRFHIEKTDD